MYTAILIFTLFTGIQSDFEPEKHVNWNLLSHDVCGKVESNRIVGGKVAPLNGYPWIVRVGTTVTFLKVTIFSCVGVLINSDTVLSAAHCVKNIPEMIELGPIRLGEYNLDTDPDCEGDFCTNPIVDIPPAEILVPEKRNVSPLENDVALIRLKWKVEFSESILPICIGNKEFFEKNFVGRMAEVAGWGVRDMDTMQGSKKLEVVKLPIQTDETCQEWYAKRKVLISSIHLCAGGIEGLDSCNGDSGGPLMIVDDGNDGPRYYVLGILSIGPNKCGSAELPGLYLKMSVFIKWLLDNLNGAADGSTRVL